MNFLKHCAERLDKGEEAGGVLEELRTRYTTTNCLKVKICKVKELCKTSDEYSICFRLMRDAILEDHDEQTLETWMQGALRLPACGRLPAKLPQNVLNLKISKSEDKACKREARQRLRERHSQRVCVPGRSLLQEARASLVEETRSVPKLALSLMLLTGRRSCEILNGSSVLTPTGAYAMRFSGQAKKRHKGETASYEISVLCPSQLIVCGMQTLRALQKHEQLSNTATSRRYQSALSRQNFSHYSGKAHGLRGLYACMALSLFEWHANYTPNYIAMCLLGHCDIEESLAYNTYYLGMDFGDETCLGTGTLTPRLPCPEEPTPTSSTTASPLDTSEACSPDG